MWKVPLFDLDYDHREQEAVLEVLKSKWLTSGGPKTKQFEDDFSGYLGEDVECCTVSSCTAALHMALMIAGIGKGDEVILPGLTFVADLNVVRLLGATPVLADSKSLEDWNVGAKNIERLITSRTKAVIIVHFAGYSCDMDKIVALCSERDIFLIEDVAHAIGAEYKGKKCGTFGDVACFSFFSNKNLAMGEGGLFVSRDKEIVKKARLLRSHGLTHMTIDRHEGKAITYDVAMVGMNYRMDEIHAALGIVQLEKLNWNNQRRKKIVRKYIKGLCELHNLVIPWEETSSENLSAYHIFPVLLPEAVDRKDFISFLKEKGIQTSIHYPAFSKFSACRDLFDEPLDVADEISERVVTLPLYPTMGVDEVDYIVDAVKEYFSILEENNYERTRSRCAF